MGISRAAGLLVGNLHGFSYLLLLLLSCPSRCYRRTRLSSVIATSDHRKAGSCLVVVVYDAGRPAAMAPGLNLHQCLGTHSLHLWMTLSPDRARFCLIALKVWLKLFSKQKWMWYISRKNFQLFWTKALKVRKIVFMHCFKSKCHWMGNMFDL